MFGYIFVHLNVTNDFLASDSASAAVVSLTTIIKHGVQIDGGGGGLSPPC